MIVAFQPFAGVTLDEFHGLDYNDWLSKGSTTHQKFKIPPLLVFAHVDRHHRNPN